MTGADKYRMVIAEARAAEPEPVYEPPAFEPRPWPPAWLTFLRQPIALCVLAIALLSFAVWLYTAPTPVG